MIEDLLERQFHTNTLSEWLLSIGIILGSIVLAKADKVDQAIHIVENICRNNQQVADNFMVFVDDDYKFFTKL